MTTITYIAYGSNLWPARLEARIPVLDVLGTVVLHDRALDFSKTGGDGSGKCNLAAEPGAITYGAVYLIPAADRETLDRIEGVGHGYEVCWLDHEDYGRCFFYTALPGAIDHDLRPYDWYKAYVVAGARHHGFPAGYLARIETVSAIGDPVAERRRDAFALLGGAGRSAP